MTTKPTVLFIDDEERIVRSLRMLFRGRCEIFATVDPHHALDIVRRERVHVVVSDQRMPIMRGVELLRQVKEISPNTMRILLTGYSELEAVVASVNEGEIFRFISKPWDPVELQETVQRASAISATLFDAAEELKLKREEGVRRDGTGFLIIDEDPATAVAVRQIVDADLQLDVPVHWSTNLEEGFELLANHDIGVVVSDIRLANEDITGALKALKQNNPEIVTVVTTPHRDTGVLIELINEGQVYRFLPKPAGRTLLGRNLASAFAYHQTLRAAPKLLQSHTVEPIRKESDQRLVSRIRGFFSRMRRGGSDLAQAYEGA